MGDGKLELSSIDKTKESKGAGKEVVSYFRLFNCDTLDYIALFFGVAGSLVNAPIMALFTVVFGKVCTCTASLADRPQLLRAFFCELALQAAVGPSSSGRSEFSTDIIMKYNCEEQDCSMSRREATLASFACLPS
jgi:hypothetical protein